MGQLSAKLRGAADGYTLFFCPGCEDAHAIRVGTGPGPRWAWNGNADAPTFTPSSPCTARTSQDSAAARKRQMRSWSASDASDWRSVENLV